MSDERKHDDLDDFDLDRLQRGVQRGDPGSIIELLLRCGEDRGYGLRPGETVDSVLRQCGVDN